MRKRPAFIDDTVHLKSINVDSDHRRLDLRHSVKSDETSVWLRVQQRAARLLVRSCSVICFNGDHAARHPRHSALNRHTDMRGQINRHTVRQTSRRPVMIVRRYCTRSWTRQRGSLSYLLRSVHIQKKCPVVKQYFRLLLKFSCGHKLIPFHNHS